MSFLSGEICRVRESISRKQSREMMLSLQKSAEVIVRESGRTEPKGKEE